MTFPGLCFGPEDVKYETDVSNMVQTKTESIFRTLHSE